MVSPTTENILVTSSPDDFRESQFSKLYISNLYLPVNAHACKTNDCPFYFLPRYTVMSGTPEKILEHFLETIRLEPSLNEATGMHPEEFCVPTTSMCRTVREKSPGHCQWMLPRQFSGMSSALVFKECPGGGRGGSWPILSSGVVSFKYVRSSHS